MIYCIRIYQRYSKGSYLKVMLGGGYRVCRYEPTCSEYAAQAILKYGPIKGLGMAIWRIMRCNPWSGGGLDPVK